MGVRLVSAKGSLVTPAEVEAEIQACANAIARLALSRDPAREVEQRRNRLFDRIASLRAQLAQAEAASA